jgi:hypothetical protein
MTPVSLTLREAREIADYLAATGPAGEIDPTVRRLARAIARANRALVPGRWRSHNASSWRSWPDRSCAAMVTDMGGWCAYSDAGSTLASGPETGAEGRRLADAALAKWAKRQGWRP